MKQKVYLVKILSILFCCFQLNSQAQNRLVSGSDSSIRILPHMVGFNNQMASSNEPWYDYNRKLALKKSAVGLLRYPGGTVSNYWDMEQQRLFQNSPDIDTLNTSPRKSIKTENVIGWVVPMKSALNTIGNLKQAWSAMSSSHSAKPAIVFVLNMITPGADYYTLKWNKTINQNPLSDDWWAMMNDRLSRNISMLDDAVANGIAIKYIEFGNEYFFGKSQAGEGKNGGAIVEPYSAGAINSSLVGAFPGNGKSYADAVNNWADTLLKRYPDVRLCAIGADANGINPSRRNSWNTDVVKHIDKSLIPAIALHVYNGIEDGNLNTSEENFGKAVASWKKHWEWVINHSTLPGDREFWFTEYNTNKNTKTWGHGLMNLFILNTWLSEGNLGLSNYHQFAQNSVSGSNIYASTRAFTMLAKATRGKTQAKQLTIVDSPEMEGTGNLKIPSVIAWQFKNETDLRFTYFLCNLSSKSISIDMSMLSGVKGTYYTMAKSSLASTNDPGEEIGMINSSLNLQANSCLFFKAGDIAPVGANNISATKTNEIIIYPNPGNKLQIESRNWQNLSFEFGVYISDITGKTIYRKEGNIIHISKELSDESSKWKNGIYFVRIKSNNLHTVKKWVKQY